VESIDLSILNVLMKRNPFYVTYFLIVFIFFEQAEKFESFSMQ